MTDPATVRSFLVAVEIGVGPLLLGQVDVAMGLEHWGGLRDFLRDPLRRGTIDAADLERIHVTDSVADAMAHIRAVEARREAERLVTPRPSRVLGEVGPPSGRD